MTTKGTGAKGQQRRGDIDASDGVSVGVVRIEELPGRRIGKGEILARLPQVEQLKKDVRRGLGVGEAAKIEFTKDFLSQMKITTSRRIMKEILKGFIAEEDLKSKDGGKLDVYNYKAENGNELVYVADAIQINRLHNDRRRKKGLDPATRKKK